MHFNSFFQGAKECMSVFKTIVHPKCCSYFSTWNNIFSYRLCEILHFISENLF